MTIENNKQKILNIIQTKVVTRNTDKLIQFMIESDYFTAPCSRRYHLDVPGGLAQHSLNVYTLFKAKNKIYDLNLSEETVAITALCHDFCKVNTYKIISEDPSEKQINYLLSLTGYSIDELFEKYPEIDKSLASSLIEWYKNGQQGEAPSYQPRYKIVDNNPIGHGEKSAMMVLRVFPEITDEELTIIRFHMGPYEAYGNEYCDMSYRAAKNKYPGVVAMFCSDYEACYILESKNNREKKS